MGAAKTGWYLALGAVIAAPLAYLPPAWFGPDSTFLLVDGAAMPKVALVRLLVAASFIAWGVAVATGELGVRRWRFDWVALAFLGWATVSTILAPDWRTALGGDTFQRMGLADIATALGLWWLLVQFVDGRERFFALARSISLSGAAVSAVAMLQVLGADPLRESEGWADRAASTLGNPGLLAVFAIAPFMLSLGLYLAEKPGRWRTVALVALLFNTASVAAAFARAGWIGALVALGVFAAVVGVRRLVVPATGVAAVAGLAVLGGLRSGASDASVLGRVTGEGSAGLLGERPAIWEAALEATAKRPLTGWGPDSFSQVYWRFTDLPYTATDGTALQALDAHSSVLGTVAALGVPGALLGVAFVVLVLWSARGALSRARGAEGSGPLMVACWAALLGMCVASLASISSLAVASTGLALMALLVSPAATERPATAVAKSVAGVGAAGLVVAAVLGFMALRATHLDAVALSSSDPALSLALAQAAAAADPLESVYARHAADRARVMAESTDPAAATAYYAQARAELESALRRSPGDHALYLSLLQLENVCAASGAPASGVEAGKRALAVGETPELLAEYGMALKFAGDDEACREALTRAVARAPRYVQARLWLAGSLMEAGKTDDARQQYVAISEIDPSNADAATMLERLSADKP